MKILLEEFNSRFEQVGERISEFKDKTIDIIQSLEQEEKRMGKMNRDWGTYGAPSNVSTFTL